MQTPTDLKRLLADRDRGPGLLGAGESEVVGRIQIAGLTTLEEVRLSTAMEPIGAGAVRTLACAPAAARKNVTDRT